MFLFTYFLPFFLIYIIHSTPINQKQNILTTPNSQITSTQTQKTSHSQTQTQTQTHQTPQKTINEPNEAESIEPIIPSVYGVSRLFYCLKDDNCQKIVEFSLAANYSFNCYELFLPIEYNVIHLNRKYPSYGFFPLNGFEIADIQQYGSYCKKISRFQINDKKEIVSILGYVFNFEKLDSDDEIQWFLLRNFYLKFWFIFFFRLYDESKDEFLFLKAFNYGIYFIGVFAIFVKFSRHLKILVIRYLEAIAENEEKPKSQHKKLGKKSD